MDEARERELLLGHARTRMTRRMTERWRLDDFEADLDVPTADLGRVLALVASRGRIVEQEDGVLALVRRAGWIGLSRVVLTCTYRQGDSAMQLHLRGVAVERRVSRRVVRKLVKRIDPASAALSNGRPGRRLWGLPR
jgi:hypothetical protein